MSEQAQPPANPQFTSQAAQAQAAPADQAQAAQSTPNALTQRGGAQEQTVEPFALPGKPDMPSCPVCQTGLLYTIAYDPEALHEQGQRGAEGDPTSRPGFVPSGGSIRLMCFNCGMPQTHPLNPGQAT